MHHQEEHMETRLSAVEQQIGGLQSDISGLRHTVGGISTDLKSLASAFDRFTVKAEATKPPSWRENISFAVQIGTLIAMIVGGIFFLVEYKVGSGTARANAFVERMESGGYLYVIISDFDRRIKSLEEAAPPRSELLTPAKKTAAGRHSR